MSVVRELITLLGFEVDDEGLKHAESGIEGLKKSAEGLAALFSGIGFGLFELVKSSAEAADGLVKTSQRLGIGVESLQKLQYAAGLADVETSEFTQAMGLLSRNVDAAATGSKEAAKLFSGLGIKIQDAHGKIRPADQLFLEISDKIKAMPDGIKKTALSMDLFGRSGSRMIPLLNGGSAAVIAAGKEIEDFGIILGQDTAEAGEKFNDSLRTVHVVLTGFRNVIGAKLIPIALELVHTFIEWMKVNREIVKEKLYEFTRGLVQVFTELYEVGAKVYQFFSTIIDKVGGFENAITLAKDALVFFIALDLAKTLVGLASGVIKVAEAFISLAEAEGLASIANPITALIYGLALLGTAFYLLKQDYDTFKAGGKSAFEDYWKQAEKLKDTLLKAGEWVMNLNDSFWNGLDAGFKKVIDLVDSFIAKIESIPFLGGIVKGIGSFLSSPNQKVENAAQYDIGLSPQQIVQGRPLTTYFENPSLTGQSPLDVFSGQGTSDIGAQGNPFSLGDVPPLPQSVTNLSQPPSSTSFFNTTPTTNQTNSFQVDQKIEVNVETGADPEKIGESVKGATEDHLGRLLSDTARVIEAGRH